MKNCISSFKLKNPEEEKVLEKIYKRKEYEENRKNRIFNPKTRLIGINVEALEEQLEEKHKIRQEEQIIEELYGQHLRKCDEITLILDEEARKERRKLAEEINVFRENYQRQEDRREYDLNDPNRLKKDLPCRLRDDDPRCGISSCQKFEGESVSGNGTDNGNCAQVKAWLEEQISAKQSRMKEQNDAENAYKDCIIARDARAVELNNLEQLCKHKLSLALNRYNKALSNEKQYEKERLKKEEAQDNLAEIYNNLISDMLTENPGVAQSNLGPGRMIGYLYKGMTEKQLEEIRLVQEQQRKEAKNRKEEEKTFNEKWERVTNAFTKIVDAMDNKIAQEQNIRKIELREENERMGKEQKAKLEYLDKIVYRNKVTAAYFENFNKTAR